MPTPGKCLLVTRAGRFIGSQLVEASLRAGARVWTSVRHNASLAFGWLWQSEYAGDVAIVSGDIRDLGSFANAMRDCDSMFHLAALIGIPYSYSSFLAYTATKSAVGQLEITYQCSFGLPAIILRRFDTSGPEQVLIQTVEWLSANHYGYKPNVYAV